MDSILVMENQVARQLDHSPFEELQTDITQMEFFLMKTLEQITESILYFSQR
jgi:hypothetical protein